MTRALCLPSPLHHALFIFSAFFLFFFSPPFHQKDHAWSTARSRCRGVYWWVGGWGGVERVQSSSHVGLMRFLGQSGPRGDVSLLAKEGTETSCCCSCSCCLSSCSLIRPVKRPSSLFPPLFFSPFSPLLFFTLVFSLPLSLAGTQRRAAGKQTNWPTGEAPVVRLGSR